MAAGSLAKGKDHVERNRQREREDCLYQDIDQSQPVFLLDVQQVDVLSLLMLVHSCRICLRISTPHRH